MYLELILTIFSEFFIHNTHDLFIDFLHLLSTVTLLTAKLYFLHVA